MVIHHVEEEAFRPYGKICKEYDLEEFLKELAKTPVTENVVYQPSEKTLEALAVSEELRQKGFGGLPIQIGYCNGHNSFLNAVEYHRNSEIDIAGTDLILLLGKQQDIEEDLTYDTGKIEAFLVPAKTAVELYATTLHYAPCGVEGKAFRCAIVLPKGTNEPLNGKAPEAGSAGICETLLLTAENKWLIAHKEAGIAGAYEGLKGVNLTVERP